MTTSENDINFMMRDLKIKGECVFDHDDIINAIEKLNDDYSLIINLINVKSDKDKVGHWIALKGMGDSVVIYTCYGIISEDLIDILSKRFKKFIFILSQKNQQNLKSESCGYYCLRFLKEFEPEDLSKLNYIIYDKNKNIVSVVLEHEDFDLKKFKNFLNVYISNL